MTLSRRVLIKLGIASTLLGWARGALSTIIGATPSETGEFGALPAYLDTLIPAEQTPGASTFNITQRLLDFARFDPAYTKILKLGSEQLDKQAKRMGGSTFATLDSAQRERVVSALAKTERGSLPRTFFDRTLHDAMRLYYAEPSNWPGLGYPGPPQPAGFTDHSQAPQPLS